MLSIHLYKEDSDMSNVRVRLFSFIVALSAMMLFAPVSVSADSHPFGANTQKVCVLDSDFINKHMDNQVVEKSNTSVFRDMFSIKGDDGELSPIASSDVAVAPDNRVIFFSVDWEDLYRIGIMETDDDGSDDFESVFKEMNPDVAVGDLDFLRVEDPEDAGFERVDLSVLRYRFNQEAFGSLPNMKFATVAPGAGWISGFDGARRTPVSPNDWFAHDGEIYFWPEGKDAIGRRKLVVKGVGFNDGVYWFTLPYADGVDRSFSKQFTLVATGYNRSKMELRVQYEGFDSMPSPIFAVPNPVQADYADDAGSARLANRLNNRLSLDYEDGNDTVQLYRGIDFEYVDGTFRFFSQVVYDQLIVRDAPEGRENWRSIDDIVFVRDDASWGTDKVSEQSDSRPAAKPSAVCLDRPVGGSVFERSWGGIKGTCR